MQSLCDGGSCRARTGDSWATHRDSAPLGRRRLESWTEGTCVVCEESARPSSIVRPCDGDCPSPSCHIKPCLSKRQPWKYEAVVRSRLDPDGMVGHQHRHNEVNDEPLLSCCIEMIRLSWGAKEGCSKAALETPVFIMEWDLYWPSLKARSSSTSNSWTFPDWLHCLLHVHNPDVTLLIREVLVVALHSFALLCAY